jgi:hypothetical protein
MRVANADEAIFKPQWDISKLALNLAFSMLAIFLPLYLTKGMSNFHPANTKKLLFSLFCSIQMRYAAEKVVYKAFEKQLLDFGVISYYIPSCVALVALRVPSHHHHHHHHQNQSHIMKHFFVIIIIIIISGRW